MSKEQQWIEFAESQIPAGRKTRIWWVIPDGGETALGEVRWYGPWRQYSFFTSSSTPAVFERKCLRDIADFCEARTREHMAAAKARKGAS